MIEYLTAHTADVPAEVLAASRQLLARVFAGEFEDVDWDHSLGGVHVVARADGALVGHASVVQRRLMTGGRPLRAG